MVHLLLRHIDEVIVQLPLIVQINEYFTQVLAELCVILIVLTEGTHLVLFRILRPLLEYPGSIHMQMLLDLYKDLTS